MYYLQGGINGTLGRHRVRRRVPGSRRLVPSLRDERLSCLAETFVIYEGGLDVAGVFGLLADPDIAWSFLSLLVLL